MSSKRSELIEKLCQAFPGFDLSPDSLTREVDVADAVDGDYDHLAAVVDQWVWPKPGGDADKPIVPDSVEKALCEISQSQDDDFFVVVLQIVYTTVHSSFTLRKLLFEAGIQSLVGQLMVNYKVDSEIGVYHQLTRVWRLFYDFGGDGRYVAEIAEAAMTTPSETNVDRYYQLVSGPRTPSDFIIFNQPTTFPISASPSKTFTAHWWYSIPAGGQSKTALFQLLGNGADAMVVAVDDGQIVVEVVTPNETSLLYPFNQHVEELIESTDGYSRWMHLAITYDDYGNLNLYINGSYSESMPCPELQALTSAWTKVVVGGSKSEVVVSNACVLNTALSGQWLALLATLGPAWTWPSKDMTTEQLLAVLGELSHRQLLDLGYKFKKLASPDAPLSSISKQILVNRLSRLSSAMVMFDMNEYYRAHNDHATGFQNSSYCFQAGPTIHDGLYVCGGTALQLAILEACLIDRQNVETSLQALFSTVNNHPRLRNEFETHGYGVLSVLLTKHASAVTDECLNALLTHCGGERAVVNKQCYRYVVLASAFDLWNSEKRWSQLVHHFQRLLSSPYANYNQVELRKMKLLKRLGQFLKMHPGSSGDEIEELVVSLLLADPSVDAIRGLSSAVVYDVASNTGDGPAALMVSALTRVLCNHQPSVKTVKKFSRSISIHWLLILFHSVDAPEMVEHGLLLLSRLLKSLGPHIIRRFFRANHGTEVLTFFIKRWWHNPAVLARLLLASIGSDSLERTPKDLVAAIETIDTNAHLVVPEFLLVLNNVVAYSLYEVAGAAGQLISSNPASPRTTVSLRPTSSPHPDESLRLIGQYMDMIESGIRVPQLRAYFVTKDWLTGVMEVIGHLDLAQRWYTPFKDARQRFTKVVASLIVPEVLANQFGTTLNTLADFTATSLHHLVMPSVFSALTSHFASSQFLYNERQVMAGVVGVLRAYQTSFVDRHYAVSPHNLQCYLECVIAAAEVDHKLPIKHQLGKLLVHKLILQPEAATIKFMLYRQLVVFQSEVLDIELTGQAIIAVLGAFLSHDNEEVLEPTCSFIRTAYLMNQPHIKEITGSVVASEYSEILAQFCETLTTSNDDESIRWLRRRDPVVKAVLKAYVTLQHQQPDTLMSVSDMIATTLGNGGRMAQLEDNLYVNQFQRDCQTLRRQIVSSEQTKNNRVLQDHQENVTFFVGHYNTMKAEVLRLAQQSPPASYTLDTIENQNRMRKRFILESQLPASERLSYHVDVPVLEPGQSSTPEIEESFLLVDGLTLEDDAEEVEYAEDRNRKVLRSLFIGDQITALWNISHIHGLASNESLLILATSHLYLISHYFCGADGNIVDVNDVPTADRDPILSLLPQSSPRAMGNDRAMSWPLARLASVCKRQFLLRDVALEIFFTDGATILITCRSSGERDQVYQRLAGYSTAPTAQVVDRDFSAALAYASFLSNGVSGSPSANVTTRLVQAFSGITSAQSAFNQVTKAWRQGRLSNFYYLILVNTVAGRTFNDLSQYPVFPWVLSDYSQESLDLSDPNVYRDLTKPMGAQTPARARQFRDRFEALASLGDDESPPFHYGTHYSSAMIVSSYLIRCQPFVQSYLLLQGGKFDHADRLFNSVERAWLSASRDNTTDVRELVPEFFYMPEFLVNLNHFNFGKLQNGDSVNDVALPPWAHGDPQVFIDKHRQALESPYVSANLHAWIDLVFGFKQTGPDAVAATNVFHHTSYSGATNVDAISDETQKRAIIGMINNFGQTPLKVFSRPHPKREVLNIANRYLTSVEVSTLTNTFTSKLAMPIVGLELKRKRRLGSSSQVWVGRPQGVISEPYLVRKTRTGFSRSFIVVQTPYLVVHDGNISVMVSLGHNGFATADEYGIIKVWKKADKLELSGVLRGHNFNVTQMVYSSSFQIAVSVDCEGLAIIWDMVRLRYIRELRFDGKVRVAISDDSGNIAAVPHDGSWIDIYSVNGERILHHEFTEPAPVSSFTFGYVGDEADESNHAYWSVEMVAMARGNDVKIYQWAPGSPFSEIDSFQLAIAEGKITALALLKQSLVDMNDRIVRGSLKLIVGDAKGKVYS
ncbi:beige protein homolog 1 [Diutina catenulata]